MIATDRSSLSSFPLRPVELVLTAGEPDLRRRLSTLCAQPGQPFSETSRAFVAAFSNHVLADHSLRVFPELVALAYWFRPAVLEALARQYQALAHDDVLRPRGVVLHFAPANVDTVFVYAWFLSLLCGNRNLLRLSRRETPLRQRLLAVLDQLMNEHPLVAEGNALITYPHDEAATAALSTLCQLRVVWGGNATVETMRRIPLPPLATELLFPDRQSWALLDAAAVCNADEPRLQSLTSAFHNDAFWFAQQACSSPRAVLWVGEAAQVSLARERFWPALQAELQRRGTHSDASELAARLTAAACACADGARVASPHPADWPLRLDDEQFDEARRQQHCGFGLFHELSRPSLSACAPLFAAADQTVAYFGFDPAVLREWVIALPDRAVDRVVPMGEALQFGVCWDGHNLLEAFSRRVVIR